MIKYMPLLLVVSAKVPSYLQRYVPILCLKYHCINIIPSYQFINTSTFDPDQ